MKKGEKPEALEQHISGQQHLARQTCEHLLSPSALVLPSLKSVKATSNRILSSLVERTKLEDIAAEFYSNNLPEAWHSLVPAYQ